MSKELLCSHDKRLENTRKLFHQVTGVVNGAKVVTFLCKPQRNLSSSVGLVVKNTLARPRLAAYLEAVAAFQPIGNTVNEAVHLDVIVPMSDNRDELEWR